MASGDWIALYGASLSTALAVIALVRWWLNRNAIQVEYSLELLPGVNGKVRYENAEYKVTITNVSRDPLTITQVSMGWVTENRIFRYRNNKLAFGKNLREETGTSLPIQITPSQLRVFRVGCEELHASKLIAVEILQKIIESSSTSKISKDTFIKIEHTRNKRGFFKPIKQLYDYKDEKSNNAKLTSNGPDFVSIDAPEAPRNQ